MPDDTVGFVDAPVESIAFIDGQPIPAPDRDVFCDKLYRAAQIAFVNGVPTLVLRTSDIIGHLAPKADDA